MVGGLPLFYCASNECAPIPTDMRAAALLGFMRTPQRSAQIDGKPVTPVEWLTRGGDPQVLREVFEAFVRN